jgi:hypothetical protein
MITILLCEIISEIWYVISYNPKNIVGTASVSALGNQKQEFAKSVLPFYIKVYFYKCTLRGGRDNIAAMDNDISEADT